MADTHLVPYICPECDEDMWVEVEGLPGGIPVTCEHCGHEDTLRGPSD
jgi:DNA-directed RNA polymerase subunit RPC12/RpoP